MGNLAVLDIAGLSPLAREGIFGGASALERSLEWASAVPGGEGIVLLAGPNDALPDGCIVIPGSDDSAVAGPLCALVREAWTEEALIDALAAASGLRLAGGHPPEALFFSRGDCPLIDGSVTRTLWDIHYKYDAEYTFADGYPIGLAPQVLSSELPSKLIPLSRGRDNPVAPDSLFEILRQDINAFDVETHLSPEDLRMDRVSITADSRRNRHIAERLYAAGGTDAESLCRAIPDNRLLLRDLPVYFPIQVTDRCPQACSYCPFSVGRDPRAGERYMEADQFTRLCDRILEFAGDAVFNPSLWGEPASHPDIGTLIRSALASGESPDGPHRSRVMVETSGIGWNESLLSELAAEYSGGRLMWIVSLDAADPELYRELRGEGQDEAESTARKLVGLFGRYCWIQAVRMNENEEHLEEFHKKWTAEGAQVIIQKYDAHAGLLPQKQPSDLSPLNRFACWHIKRDMPILLDGTVPACRVQFGREEPLGNVFSDSLDAIWSAGSRLHEQHVAGEYPGCCKDCDEYYTFNF